MEMMTGSSLAALHQEGNRLFDEGKLGEAARAFRSAVDRFHADHRADAAAVREFVAIAGNLCVCHHAMGDWNTCVATARELLSTYPVIPKAYAAIGMCIVSRLLHQEAEQQNEELRNSPHVRPRSGEEVRRDARRYLVKLGGVVCTPDDAHTYLCRAILLSDAQLQVSLGPYLETAVRWVSEELLSAGLSLEREYGDRVLGHLSALETSLRDVPPLLDTAPAATARQTIRVLDAATMGSGGGAASSRRVEELPDDEAEAIMRTIQEGQQMAREGEDGSSTASGGGASGVGHAAPPTKPSLEPVDFLFSRQRIAVHVCHAERGGIPRGLTLARSSGPFAVAQHLQLPHPAHPTSPDSAGAGSCTLPLSIAAVSPGSSGETGPVVHTDPHRSGDVVSTIDAHDMLAQCAVTMGELSSASEAPPLLMCNACGKEMNPLTTSGPPPSGCPVCNGVVYCSAACAAAYRTRHERYECALRVALQSRVEELAAAAAQRPPQPEMQLPAGEVVPGAGWDALELHRHVLPLCISVYSGLQSNAAGSAGVRAKVELKAQRRLVHCLPADVADTLARWVDSGDVLTLNAVTADEAAKEVMTAAAGGACGSGTQDLQSVPAAAAASSSSSTPLSAPDLLHAIFFLARLHGDTHTDSRSSSLFLERLLLRHSCEPNCVWSDTLHTLLTSRYICKGEELTVAVSDHFPQHWPWQIRQKWFVHHHGVPCQCARCTREGGDLNDTRGTLSNALVEQLLTGDLLGHPCPTTAHQHPTHLFHRQVQRLVEQSRAPQRNVPTLLRRLDEMRAELRQHVLPSHYLLEDLRRALINVAEPEGHTATTTSAGQESLLFWEAMWSGAVPAKRTQIRLLPSVFECGRRRRVPPQQQRRRRRPSGVVGTGASPSPTRHDDGPEGGDAPAAAPTASGEVTARQGERRRASLNRTSPPSAAGSRLSSGGGDGDDDTRKPPAAGTPRLTALPAPLIATKDFSSGRSVVDLFYGSYQTWYM